MKIQEPCFSTMGDSRVRRLLIAVVLLLTFADAPADPTNPDVWLEFSHPDNPHQWIPGSGQPGPEMPIKVDPLFAPPIGDNLVSRPTLVVLMEYDNMAHRTVHDVNFWRNLVFGDPRTGNYPSVGQNVVASSNGRLQLTAATASDLDGTPDGVIGWVTAPSQPGCCRDSNDDGIPLVSPQCEAQGHTWLPGSTSYYDCYIEVKRGAAIAAADANFDYSWYDADGNRVISTDELLIIAVFADNAPTGASCEQHDLALGHTNPSGCVSRPGGNTRATVPEQVPVEQSSGTPMTVFQHIAGVGEMTNVAVVTHEIAHSTFGLTDLYHVFLGGGGCQNSYQQVADGYLCNGDWYPPPPARYTLMDDYRPDILMHMDPWAKMHLGFMKPAVVTHDGVYQLHAAETARDYSDQLTEPEALIVYDPLRANPYNEYFLLENRNMTTPLLDRGLAVWLIQEPHDDPRHTVRLVRQNGHWSTAPGGFTWNGADATYYDLTATSTPRDSSWTDGTPSQLEIYDISPAGDTMTFSVRMTPIFVDHANGGTETGTANQPFNTILEAVNAIPVAPRTLRISGGSYPAPIVISTPLTLMSTDSANVSIGQ